MCALSGIHWISRSVITPDTQLEIRTQQVTIRQRLGCMIRHHASESGFPHSKQNKSGKYHDEEMSNVVKAFIILFWTCNLTFLLEIKFGFFVCIYSEAWLSPWMVLFLYFNMCQESILVFSPSYEFFMKDFPWIVANISMTLISPLSLFIFLQAFWVLYVHT